MGVRTVQPHRAAGGRVARRPAVSHNEGVRKRPRKGARRPTADSLVFSFLSAADVVEARLEAALSPTGLSLAKLAVLHFLADAKEALPLSDLAARQHRSEERRVGKECRSRW